MQYRRSGNFHVKNNSREKFVLLNFRGFVRSENFFLTVDDARYQESQGSLAVVVDWTFTPGSVDLRASLFTDHRRVFLFFECLIFAVGLDREIILTATFSRSTVPAILV